MEDIIEIPDPNRWIVLIIFSFFSFSNAMQWVTYAPIATSVTTYFSLDTYQLNMLSMIYEIIFIIGALLTCTVFESWGVRKGVLIGSFLNALGAVLKFAPGLYLPSYVSVIIPQTFNSASQLFILSTPPLLASQYFPPHRRTFATAVSSTANGLGNAVALFVPPLIVKEPSRHQLEILFAMEMGICVTIFLSVIFFLTPPKYASPSAALLLRAQRGAKENIAASRSILSDGSGYYEDEDPLQIETDYCLNENCGKVSSPLGYPSGKDVQCTGSNVKENPLGDEGLEKPTTSSSPSHGKRGHPSSDKNHSLTIPTMDTTYETEEGGEREGRDGNSSASHRKSRLTLWWRSIRNHPQMVILEEIFYTILALVQNKGFVCLWMAFSIGIGSLWTFSSVLAQISTPFGVSEVLAGISGACNVIAGTLMAYVVGLVVDRCHRYRVPLMICLGGSVVFCVGYVLVMSFVPRNTTEMNVLSLTVYILTGVFQSTSTPISFEFAMEICFPHQESVPGVLLMVGANLLSLIMTLIASAMLGNGVATPEAARNVVIMITGFCAVGFVFACFPREHLRRREAELLDQEKEQLVPEEECHPNFPESN